VKAGARATDHAFASSAQAWVRKTEGYKRQWPVAFVTKIAWQTLHVRIKLSRYYKQAQKSVLAVRYQYQNSSRDQSVEQ